MRQTADQPGDSYSRKRLGAVLLEQGRISPQQLESALDAQEEDGRLLGSILVGMGLLDQPEITHALAEQRHDVPEVPAAELGALPAEVAQWVPETLARRFNVIGLRQEQDGVLIVAMENPTDLAALDLLSHVLDRPIESVKGPAEDIASAIDNCYGQALGARHPAGGQSLEQISLEIERSDAVVAPEPAATDLMASAKETPIVRFVEVLFREAASKRASDVHLEPAEHVTNVRLRIDGVLQRLLSFSRRMHPAVISRIKILSGMDIAERRLPQDGRCRVKFSGHEVDVRISSLPTVHGEKVVMRLLDKSQARLDLRELGFGETDLDRFTAALRAPYGMILLSGPTGSGKTTTLYAGLTFLNQEIRNIVTVEDPVEYELPGVSQVQVKPHIGLSFAAGLRSILRQDPNVIMVGEMRDLETTQIAVRAALTGHLVLSTLHANNAPAVVSRLRDIGVPAYLITASLILAVAQRLVRRLCPQCKEAFQPSPEVADRLAAEEGIDQATLYRAEGCEACDYTGYHGRVGLYEMMPFSPRLKEMVLASSSEQALRETARQERMQTLVQQGLRKVLEGVTTMEEVLSVPGQEE